MRVTGRGGVVAAAVGRAQPEGTALSEFFREVSEDFGEDFAFAALGAADAGEQDSRLAHGEIGRGHARLRWLPACICRHALETPRTRGGRGLIVPGGCAGRARRAKEKKARARRRSSGLVVFFQDIERVAVMELHADGAQDRADGAGGSALLADDFADVLGSNLEPEDSVLLAGNGLHLDCSRLRIGREPGDIADRSATESEATNSFWVMFLPLTEC